MKSTRWIAAALFVIAGTAGARADETVTVHVKGWTCADCSQATREAVGKLPGVAGADADYKAGTLTVRFDPARVTEGKIAATVTEVGFQVEGAKAPVGLKTDPPKSVFPEGADVVFSVRDGSAIDLPSVLAKGKYTIVDFYADWCLPCRALDKKFATLLAKRNNVALRKLNIVDWDSPVSKQYLANVDGIPYVRLYGPDGKLLGDYQGLTAADDIEARLPQS